MDLGGTRMDRRDGAGGSPGATPDRVIVISDLHIGAGRQPDGDVDPLEHFHQDGKLEVLIHRLARRATRGGRRAELVLNGDVFDFVRVANLPASPAEVDGWRELLEGAGVTPPPGVLEDAAAGRFSRLERRYGYDCAEHTSVWKLWLMARGHPRVFAALARWCAEGHSLVVVRGNHDSEWAWPGVREALRVILARLGARDLAPDRIRFRMHAYRRGNLWVEHGHAIRWSTRPPRVFTDGRPRSLLLPIGSVMNRYVLNPLERLLERTPGEPSSLHLKRLARHQPWRLWLGVARNALRSLPALVAATRRLWHHSPRGWWPAWAGSVLGAAVLALPLLSRELAGSLALGSGYARAGAAALAIAAPPAGLALIEILAAARDSIRVQARAYALERAMRRSGRRGRGARRGRGERGGRGGRADPGRLRLIVLGHTHAPDLHQWDRDGGRVVYANPGCWMAEAPETAAPRFFWCALRDGAYGDPRIFELDPARDRFRQHSAL